MSQEEKTTGILTKVLASATPDQLSHYLEQYADALITDEKPFAAYMRALFKKKNLRQQDVFLAADISEGYGYKLISEEKRTRQRDVILRLCLAGHFTLNETQQALKLYGMAPLYPRLPRDAALIIAFNTGVRDPEGADEILKSHCMTPLYCCRGEE